MKKKIYILLISSLVLLNNNFAYGDALKLLPLPSLNNVQKNGLSPNVMPLQSSGSNGIKKESVAVSGNALQLDSSAIKPEPVTTSGNSFAPTEKDKKNQQQEAQKMTQLKQILTQISSGENNINSQSAASNATPTLSTAAKVPPVAASMPAPAALVATTEAKKQTDLYDVAFSGVVGEMLPMSPAQINKLKEVFVDTQLAVATPPGNPPKPTTSSLLVNLSPQATAPVIRLSAGYLTSLVFIDATGQPWPIAAYSVGDPSAFNIQWDRKGNTLLVQSSTFYKRSNLAVMLKDLNTPVMITLLSGQQAVDYRVDLRVPGIGPNAIYVQNGVPDAINPVLFDVLNGITPKGGKELKVTGGGNTQAYLVNEKASKKMYLRTNLTITSPGWQSTMSSADGTRAYQLQPVPVILALQHGKDKTIRLMIEGLE